MHKSIVTMKRAPILALTMILVGCVSDAEPEPDATWTPEILADYNRDGVVTAADRISGPDQTAIILPNIGDVHSRCPSSAAAEYSDDALEACHDAQDNEPRAPDYFAPIKLSAMPQASDAATGRLQAKGPGADKLRVFLKQGSDWEYVETTDTLSAATLRAGAELGVDARDVVRDTTIWDGRIELEFAVTDGDATASHMIGLRVAPVIIHNHLENATEVFVPQSNGPVHETFVQDLTTAMGKFKSEAPLRTLNTTDNWAQDFVEFGHVSMPGPDEPKTIRIAVRSPQPTRSAGRALFDLKGPGFGVVQIGGDDYHQADSFGNLETVPPYTHNGQTYPAGRVIYGDAGDGIAPHTDFMTFFEAQSVQAPILLDTSWLIIAHVDEFLQFLPADTARGWTIAVKDVPSALAVLREARSKGHGDVKAFSRDGAPDMTINELLSDQAFLEDNERARRRVEMNLERLMAETGISAEEVVRIPGLFKVAGFAEYVQRASVRDADQPPPPWLEEEGPGSERIVYSPGNLVAFYPAAVNGLLMDETNYIPPKQWGPVVNGVDIMEAAVIEAYAKAGITAWSINDWDSHHTSAGEVHCGTNVTRTVETNWWD